MTFRRFLEFRKGNLKNCQHAAPAQRCLYCALLEPYDEKYLKEEGLRMADQAQIPIFSQNAPKFGQVWLVC